MRIDIKPETTLAEIDQNVRTILATRKGTQPLDRDLGLDAQYLDQPGTRGQALMSAAVMDALPAQEPRVDVKQVRFTGDPERADYQPIIDYEVIE